MGTLAADAPAAVSIAAVGSLAVGSPGPFWQGQGSRLEAHSWRNEELGGKGNKALAPQAEEPVSTLGAGGGLWNLTAPA